MKSPYASIKRSNNGLPVESRPESFNTDHLQTALLTCGITAPVLYVVTNVVCVMLYKGYSVSDQTVSELSAIDTPTRSTWVLLVSIYSVLMIAFACGIWLFAKHNRSLRLVAMFIMTTITIGFFWPPMHQREVLAAGGHSLTDTLHIAFTAITVPLMILQIVFGGAAFGKWFRLYSIATLILLIVAGTLTGIDGPKIEKNLPTPWIGIWERINIGVYMLWVIVLASMILQKRAKDSIR